MSVPKCETCRFGVRKVNHSRVDDSEMPYIECRRYPPQCSIDTEYEHQAWPDMELTDWCGEWQKV